MVVILVYLSVEADRLFCSDLLVFIRIQDFYIFTMLDCIVYTSALCFILDCLFDNLTDNP